MKAEIEGYYPIVVIDELIYEKSKRMPRSVLVNLIRKFNQDQVRDEGNDWVNEFREVALLGWWQDHGYYNVKVTAKPLLIREDSAQEHFSVSVHVDEGIPYRLSGVRFVNADPEGGLSLPQGQLRKSFQIRDGEILNVDKIRKGVENLTRLYGTIGYVDFTAEPRLETDDAHRRVSVLMRLSEQKPYTIGKIDVLGRDPELEKKLRSTIKEGDVYNSKLIEDFFTTYKSILPPDSSPMTSIRFERNVKAGTVDLLFDLRMPCSPEAD